MRKSRAHHSTRYRVIDGKHSVELKLRTPHQLFDERDPAPFREKDLDDDAARYIHGSYRDLKGQGEVKLSLYFSEMGDFETRPQVIRHAIHAFFGFEADSKRRELQDIFRQGTVSFAIGALFLFLCTWLSGFLPAAAADWALTPMFKEGLAIMGWVAMWRPISIFLYEWWPIREAMNTYLELSELEIDISPNEAAHLARIRESEFAKAQEASGLRKRSAPAIVKV